MKMSMGAQGAKRKTYRTYDISGRQEFARRRHGAALDHAEQLFLERGYAATTVESIAQVAGVSAATIYKCYGGKVGLVRELCARHYSVTAQRRRKSGPTHCG